MIIKDFQLQTIVDKSQNSFGLLIFGPNEGLIREKINKIKNEYLNLSDFEEISLDGKELEKNPEELEIIINTVSMFYKNKFLIVELLKERGFQKIEKLLENLPSNIIIVIKSENLSKSSKMRKYFETSDTVYSLACYEEDTKSLMKNIDKFARDNNFSLSREIKSYLVQSSSGDYMINKNELEKLLIYLKNKKDSIDLNDISYLINDTSFHSINRMNESVMNGNTNRSSIIIKKLLSEGTSPISLVRGLMNYLLRIQKTKIEMKKGNSFDMSIKQLKPPVFWKDKDIFKNHCYKWPMQKLEKILTMLLETEIKCKLNSKLANVSFENSILYIANSGKKYFG